MTHTRCLPGKEMGVHAGYDAKGELVYIGLGDLKMHRAIMDRIQREFDKEFGAKDADTDK